MAQLFGQVGRASPIFQGRGWRPHAGGSAAPAGRAGTSRHHARTVGRGRAPLRSSRSAHGGGFPACPGTSWARYKPAGRQTPAPARPRSVRATAGWHAPWASSTPPAAGSPASGSSSQGR
jgi:hypothetical protein